jgi:outer membrane protein OmpA-like peptidoglycan-associated protein
MNIVESIKEDINSELMSALAVANDETVEKTKITVDTSLTSLLLAFMKRASTETGLHLLHNLTSPGNFSVHNPMDSIFPSDKINKLADEGNALISKIIPDKKSPLITFVSSYSGVRNAAANRANGIVTLLILNKLKQITTSKSLDLGGLAELFADQKDYLIENAPKSLIEKLSQHIGLGNLISLGSSIISTSATLSSKNDKEKQKIAESNTRYASNETIPTSGGFNIKNWIIPGVFGLVILGLVGYYIYSQKYGIESNEETAVVDSLVNINDTTKVDSLNANMVKPANSTDTLVVEMEEQILPDGQKLTLEKDNLAYLVYNFLADTSAKFRTKTITSTSPSFGNSGIDLLADQSETYDNIGKIMKAYDQSQVRVIVNQYASSDSTSDSKTANRKAFSIKKAMMKYGIQPNRIDAIGKFSNAPSNESLRAKEVVITVMKK